MDALTIHFQLRELDRIEPWGTPSKGLSLSWFGLTDGWYDVQIGEHHLYRGTAIDDPGVDYQVVRLWEDLIEVAPRALEPVPAPLVTRLADDDWDDWTMRAFEIDDHDLRETALSWWWTRQMSSAHLRAAPDLGFWRAGDELHVRWRSRARKPDDPEWASPVGDAAIDAAAFRAELVRFDRELIAQMRARVEQVAAGWSRPEIRIDLEQLQREQTDRAVWLERALAKPVRTSWDDVLAALPELEHRVAALDSAP